MKIIDKSGNKTGNSEETFYLILHPQSDSWDGDSFSFEEGCKYNKYNTEEDAIEDATPSCVVAKVTIVAKIV